MIFASGLGIVLSLVFGCLLLAIIAELYYLLWWKKLRANSTSTRVEDDYSTHTKEHFRLFCWNKPPNSSTINHQTKGNAANAVSTTNSNRHRDTTATNPETHQDPLDVELGSSKEFLLRALGGDQDAALVEAELMRLHNRFLFTITEETKEDLESANGRSRKGSRTRSLSDLIIAADPPLVSPLSSPPLTNNASSLGCYGRHGFNPLFETELNRLRSSPPPKLKFLRDAEEKLYRRLLEEAEKLNKIEIGNGNGGFQNSGAEEGDGSFVRVVVGKNGLHSNSTQVLPLASSPTPLTSSIDKKPILD